MPNYKLNIAFREADLNVIYEAGEKVVIVKHTAGDSDTQVAWVSFAPFINNTITWSTNFALYASTSEIQNGAEITKLSDKAASTQVMYNFMRGTFQCPEPAPMLSLNAYALKNLQENINVLTFGLAQDVVINGNAQASRPINAILVPKGHSATMTPIEKLDIFLHNEIEGSTVISHINSIVLPITYTEEREHTVEYNGDIGQFFLK